MVDQRNFGVLIGYSYILIQYIELGNCGRYKGLTDKLKSGGELTRIQYIQTAKRFWDENVR